MFSVDKVINEKLPAFSQRYPALRYPISAFLKYLFHEKEFQQFENKYPHLEGFDFVEQALEYFEFDYRVYDRELHRIPTTGRVIIVANHPIGSLDGLALLKMVREVRPDVRVVGNDILANIDPLRSVLMPVDNMGNRTRKESIKNIRQWLNNEGALIIFPAGEVSRFSPAGIRDGRWNSGFLRFAQATDSPILPVFVNGRNSVFFYALSMLAKPLSTLWLVREMFKQTNQHVDIRIGHQVHPEQYGQLDVRLDVRARQFKKHIYRLAKGKALLGFQPDYDSVAHPENALLLKREIQRCECLGATQDGKQIYLYRYHANSLLMREIGRLREMTFRAVKEGSGLKRDIDRFDHYYDHIVLWDKDELEIVGAYRMVRTQYALCQDIEKPKLYTQTLFDFHHNSEELLANSLELGRSFVQPKYWGKRSLDYLWFGIGAYLRKHPELEYMFGPVSISQAYSDRAKDLLVYFYSEFFPSPENLACAPNEYKLTTADRQLLDAEFCGLDDYKSRFRKLRELMDKLGEPVPTLFKQYTELCESGGAGFAAFNIDHDFSDCIDGLLLIKLDKIRENKQKRYIGNLTGNSTSGSEESRLEDNNKASKAKAGGDLC